MVSTTALIYCNEYILHWAHVIVMLTMAPMFIFQGDRKKIIYYFATIILNQCFFQVYSNWQISVKILIWFILKFECRDDDLINYVHDSYTTQLWMTQLVTITIF